MDALVVVVVDVLAQPTSKVLLLLEHDDMI
jgi:hypothetical protein